MHYHQLSFILSVFKFFMIVDDSFSRLTTRMIVRDSFSVSCFGNRRPDSDQYFLKCFIVHAEHFVVSGSVLRSKFFHQFLYSAFVSPFDPFPCPSSLPPTLSRFIFGTFLQQIDYQETSSRTLSSRKFILLHVCLTGRHLVLTFLRGKSLELPALVTLLELLPVNYRRLSRTSLAV